MILVKVGGAKNLNWNEIGTDLKTLSEKEQIILVHGASKIRDDIAVQMGAPTQTVVSPSGVSSVFTDQTAMDIFLMSYPGLVNKTIVAKLQQLGINAIGLSGVDGRIWEGVRKDKILIKENGKIFAKTGNMTGRVEKINTKLILDLLGSGYLPVITPPAISYEGEIINVDNDLAIAVMGRELKIEKLVVLFEAPGLLEKFGDESSLIKEIPKDKIDDFLKFGEGRMKKKIIGAKEALNNGVSEVIFGDSRVNNPIQNALNYAGTVIR
jgi:[amino group carrier protein]-L-2-aminoadipate 6-kinase